MQPNKPSRTEWLSLSSIDEALRPQWHRDSSIIVVEFVSAHAATHLWWQIICQMSAWPSVCHRTQRSCQWGLRWWCVHCYSWALLDSQRSLWTIFLADFNRVPLSNTNLDQNDDIVLLTTTSTDQRNAITLQMYYPHHLWRETRQQRYFTVKLFCGLFYHRSISDLIDSVTAGGR